MAQRYISDTVELLYLSLMLRWERTAPPDRHKGLLDGHPEYNSQTARLAYIVGKLAAGRENNFYLAMAQSTRRKDGRSYFSPDSSWMREPYSLCAGWYFEGCTSLLQKQDLLQHVTKLGQSAIFANCLDHFVAGKSVARFVPAEQEQKEILKDLIERGELNRSALEQ